MSKYKQQPLDFSTLSTIPIAARGGKVRAEHFARPHAPGGSISDFLGSLPQILAADTLREAALAILEARSRRRAILWGLGGHVVKCGLAPIFIDMMERGFVTGLALNGAAAIHDFEIAIAGATSEDVEAVLPDGRFGTAEETGREMNHAIAHAASQGIGIGEALGERLDKIADPKYAASSILLHAWRRSIPLTVHVAIGTDTPHTHPSASGADIGAATHTDFRLFASLVRELNDGGVYLNVGSAVLLPEVFLKALSSVRNLGFPVASFVTANFDFLQHYRPRVNVVERPHAQSGGRGLSLTGHHEILIPLLAAILVESGS